VGVWGVLRRDRGVFIGRHTNKIDKKGRVSVPKPFRDALGNVQGIYVFPSFKFPALEAAGEAFIKRFVDSLDDLDLFSDAQDDLAATVLANAHSLAYDPEGRVMLPKLLIEHAGIAEEAVFVGRGSRFQIWSPAEFESHNTHAFERARARGATLALRRPSSDSGSHE
jgi:MraZ protein